MTWRHVVPLLAMVASCDRAAPEPATPPLATPSTDVATSKRPACVKALAASAPPLATTGVDPRCPADPQGGPPMVPIGHVGFPEAPKAPRLEVELMLTEPNQERGLMYRKSLADDHGMLFAWSTPSVHTFWMHNTCIPLDMLFIDDQGWVAGTVENAPTMDDGPRTVACPASFVLEVNAGWARRYGVVPAQKVDIQGLDAAK